MMRLRDTILRAIRFVVQRAMPVALPGRANSGGATASPAFHSYALNPGTPGSRNVPARCNGSELGVIAVRPQLTHSGVEGII